jgi:hypothetical protein
MQQLAEAPEVSDAVELTLQPRAEQPVAVRAESVPARVVTPADLLNIAMQSGDKDIERLERLMQMDLQYRALQENDRKRDAALQFESDFAAFKGENIIIPKSKEVNRGRGGSFMQAEFDSVCRMLSPALSKHGFGFRHKQTFGSKPYVVEGVEKTAPWVWVTCILSHRGGHADTLELDGPADDQTVNSAIQNAQSSASYLKRQSLLAITGTATGGEDDEQRPPKPVKVGGGQQDDTPDPLDALRDAGRSAAMAGMVTLTAWWSKLSAREQKDMSGDFTGLRKAARAADEGAR